VWVWERFPRRLSVNVVDGVQISWVALRSEAREILVVVAKASWLTENFEGKDILKTGRVFLLVLQLDPPR
jgi:hypothetical protein